MSRSEADGLIADLVKDVGDFTLISWTEYTHNYCAVIKCPEPEEKAIYINVR